MSQTTVSQASVTHISVVGISNGDTGNIDIIVVVNNVTVISGVDSSDRSVTDNCVAGNSVTDNTVEYVSDTDIRDADTSIAYNSVI